MTELITSDLQPKVRAISGGKKLLLTLWRKVLSRILLIRHATLNYTDCANLNSLDTVVCGMYDFAPYANRPNYSLRKV